MARRKSTTTAAPAQKPEPQAQPETVTLVGRLCADPVLRHTKSGKAVANLRVAVNPAEGEATFHSVVVWERTAEAVCQYLRKGRPVEVEGRPQERCYTTADGTEREVNEIVARRVTFISAKALRPEAAEKEVAEWPPLPATTSAHCVGVPALLANRTNFAGGRRSAPRSTGGAATAAPSTVGTTTQTSSRRCRGCGMPHDEQRAGTAFCDDCEPSDCRFCGTPTPRGMLSKNAACIICERGEVA